MNRPIPSAYNEVAAFYDALAPAEPHLPSGVGAYRALVRGLYQTLVPPGRSVLEIGCGSGELLAGLSPARGVGVDVSAGMLETAQARYPHLEWVHCAGEEFAADETFDYVVLSDVAPYVNDLQAVFETAAHHMHPGSRLILNTFSNAWRPIVFALEHAGVRPHHPIRNWVTPGDLQNLLALAGLELVTQRREFLIPTRAGAASYIANGFLARIPALRQFAASYWMVARTTSTSRADATVSVIVPCRNEAGSIDEIVDRVPDMGAGTEIVFVEGGSSDDTRALIERAIERSDRDMKLVVQSRKGKANAVHEAFAAAKNDIVMILDGDLTVDPADLPKFYDGLVTGRGEMLIGARLVYGMERGAMRFLNLVGNKFFAWLMTFVLGQYARDTLCGTKALYRADYERMLTRRHEIEQEDPFGDFDFLLGAALLGLKIVNVPVRYSARKYGEPQISRFSDGGLLFKLAAAGYKRIWLRPVTEPRGDVPERTAPPTA